MLRKRKKNRGRFVWVSAGGPDQDLFLVSQFKKTTKKKLVFIRSSWDVQSSHGPFFSSEIASQVKQDLFLEFWLVTILNFGIGRKGNWNRLMLQNRIKT